MGRRRRCSSSSRFPTTDSGGAPVNGSSPSLPFSDTGAAMMGTPLLLFGDSIGCESCPAVSPISSLTRAFAVGASSCDGGFWGQGDSYVGSYLLQRAKDFDVPFL